MKKVVLTIKERIYLRFCSSCGSVFKSLGRYAKICKSCWTRPIKNPNKYFPEGSK